MMKTIEVTAAIIIQDGKVFATQRGYGDLKGWWNSLEERWNRERLLKKP